MDTHTLYPRHSYSLSEHRLCFNIPEGATPEPPVPDEIQRKVEASEKAQGTNADAVLKAITAANQVTQQGGFQGAAALVGLEKITQDTISKNAAAKKAAAPLPEVSSLQDALNRAQGIKQDAATTKVGAQGKLNFQDMIKLGQNVIAPVESIVKQGANVLADQVKSGVDSVEKQFSSFQKELSALNKRLEAAPNAEERGKIQREIAFHVFSGVLSVGRIIMNTLRGLTGAPSVAPAAPTTPPPAPGVLPSGPTGGPTGRPPEVASERFPNVREVRNTKQEAFNRAGPEIKNAAERGKLFAEYQAAADRIRPFSILTEEGRTQRAKIREEMAGTLKRIDALDQGGQSPEVAADLKRSSELDAQNAKLSVDPVRNRDQIAKNNAELAAIEKRVAQAGKTNAEQQKYVKELIAETERRQKMVVNETSGTEFSAVFSNVRLDGTAANLTENPEQGDKIFVTFKNGGLNLANTEVQNLAKLMAPLGMTLEGRGNVLTISVPPSFYTSGESVIAVAGAAAGKIITNSINQEHRDFWGEIARLGTSAESGSKAGSPEAKKAEQDKTLAETPATRLEAFTKRRALLASSTDTLFRRLEGSVFLGLGRPSDAAPRTEVNYKSLVGNIDTELQHLATASTALEGNPKATVDKVMKEIAARQEQLAKMRPGIVKTLNEVVAKNKADTDKKEAAAKVAAPTPAEQKQVKDKAATTLPTTPQAAKKAATNLPSTPAQEQAKGSANTPVNRPDVQAKMKAVPPTPEQIQQQNKKKSPTTLPPNAQASKKAGETGQAGLKVDAKAAAEKQAVAGQKLTLEEIGKLVNPFGIDGQAIFKAITDLLPDNRIDPKTAKEQMAKLQKRLEQYGEAGQAIWKRIQEGPRKITATTPTTPTDTPAGPLEYYSQFSNPTSSPEVLTPVLTAFMNERAKLEAVTNPAFRGVQSPAGQTEFNINSFISTAQRESNFLTLGLNAALQGSSKEVAAKVTTAVEARQGALTKMQFDARAIRDGIQKAATEAKARIESDRRIAEFEKTAGQLAKETSNAVNNLQATPTDGNYYAARDAIDNERSHFLNIYAAVDGNTPGEQNRVGAAVTKRRFELQDINKTVEAIGADLERKGVQQRSEANNLVANFNKQRDALYKTTEAAFTNLDSTFTDRSNLQRAFKNANNLAEAVTQERLHLNNVDNAVTGSSPERQKTVRAEVANRLERLENLDEAAQRAINVLNIEIRAEQQRASQPETQGNQTYTYEQPSNGPQRRVLFPRIRNFLNRRRGR